MFTLEHLLLSECIAECLLFVFRLISVFGEKWRDTDNTTQMGIKWVRVRWRFVGWLELCVWIDVMLR